MIHIIYKSESTQTLGEETKNYPLFTLVVGEYHWFRMHAQLLVCLFYHWMTAWQLLNGAENLEWTTEPYIVPHLMEPGGSCWSKNVQLFFSCHVRATEKSTDPKFPTFMIWWRNVSLFQLTILIPYTAKVWSHDEDISHIKDPNLSFMFTDQRTRVFVSCIIILFDLNITQYFYNNYIYTIFNNYIYTIFSSLWKV